MAQVAEHAPVAYLGSVAYMQQLSQQVPASLDEELQRATSGNASLSCLAWDGWIRAVFVFREHIRPGARQAIARLRDMGLQVALLTGDHRRRADQLARELGVCVHAELLPEDKLLAIEQLRKRHGAVAMVGDGVNDAPALAAADVGIAMGCGADVSRDAADVCLLGNNLERIPWAIRWARDTRRIIRQNLFWAFAYNLAGVTLAVSQRLSPIVAAIAMVVSSLFVVSNSLRLSQTNPCREPRPQDVAG
jgi:P-type E1-E2 ATPase